MLPSLEKNVKQQLPKDTLKTYFDEQESGQGFRISETIRNVTTFRQLNLIGSWPMKHQFDVVFCRNVVIYFDETTQARLWERFADVIKPGGWLFLGHSERIQDQSKTRFKSVGVTAYRKD